MLSLKVLLKLNTVSQVNYSLCTWQYGGLATTEKTLLNSAMSLYCEGRLSTNKHLDSVGSPRQGSFSSSSPPPSSSFRTHSQSRTCPPLAGRPWRTWRACSEEDLHE